MGDGEAIHSQGDAAAPADGGFMSGKGLAGGIGAVVGGLATLAGTLGVKELLQNNPFFALALFALLAAILIFGIALMGGSSISRFPVLGFALGLLTFGIASGFVAMIRGPAKVELIVSATPSFAEAQPIKFGTDDVPWNGQKHLFVGGPLTLDLTGVQAYFAQKEAQDQTKAAATCTEIVQALATNLKVGPGAPGPQPPGA